MPAVSQDATLRPLHTPRISIIMPVFNAGCFLRQAVKSIFAQTFEDWELIFVDDGSTDDSATECLSYTQERANAVLLRQNNAGPAAARNTGMRSARGEFIFFVDADDELPPDALALLLAAADTYGGDVIQGNFTKLDSVPPPRLQPAIFAPGASPCEDEIRILEGTELFDYVRHFLNYPSNHLVSYCWARLYRRALLVDHAIQARESMRLFEDFAFNLSVLGIARKLVFVNRPVYTYILRNQHVSASMAILNAGQLASDMNIFRDITNHFAQAMMITPEARYRLQSEIGHTLVHYAIIFIIRSCRQIDEMNRAHVLAQIRKLVASEVIRESLPHYHVRPGSSRWIPILMRLKLISLLAVIAKARGNQRYGKLKNGTA